MYCAFLALEIANFEGSKRKLPEASLLKPGLVLSALLPTVTKVPNILLSGWNTSGSLRLAKIGKSELAQSPKKPIYGRRNCEESDPLNVRKPSTY